MSREKINRSNKALVHWDDLISDAKKIAAGYESDGWETLLLHPGDVSTVTEGNARFQLVVPESELEMLEEVVESDKKSFDEFELHRATVEDLLLFVVVVKSKDHNQAIIFLTYYDTDTDENFVTAIREQGSVFTEITNLNQSQRYCFCHDDASLFLR